MSLSDKQNPKNKNQIPTSDEIWQILKETAKRQEEIVKHHKETAKRQEESNRSFNEKLEKRRIEFKTELKESSAKFEKELKESRAKFEKELKESSAKFEKELKESRVEFDRKMNKMRGIWSNAWGDFVESLVSGSLVKMLQDWIPSINTMTKNIECHRNGRDCEIDILAINNDSLVATEVKSTLNVKDVQDFLDKLKNFSMFLPQFKDYKVYGAVAYLKVTQSADKFAMKQGLFVIRATGDSGEILNKKGVFEPQAIKQTHTL